MKTDLKSRLLELMSSPAYMPQRKRGLARLLKVPEESYRAFKTLLEDLAQSGEIAELRKGKYGLPLPGKPTYKPVSRPAEFPDTIPAPQSTGHSALSTSPGTEHSALGTKEKPLPKNVRIGRIDIKRGGMGFLLSDPPGNDLFIAAEDLGGAISGDKVAVELQRRAAAPTHKRGKFFRGGGGLSRPTARVIKILERKHDKIVGTYFAHRGSGALPGSFHRKREQGKLEGTVVGHVIPDTRGLFAELEVLYENRGDAQDQDKVGVELVEPTGAQRSTPTARIVKIFGKAGDADADIAAILENYDVKTSFPEEVLAAADAIEDEIPEEELARRVNYEHPVTFTIDPDDAKDHDDAVAIRTEPNGNVTLLVHIADVAHYVREDSVIDLEARARATSVYLPGRVYPMLPPSLSNDQCSLKEGKLRLTNTVSITYGKNLTPIRTRIERSYIRSAAFLTYNQVREALDENKPELVRTPEIFETLKVMKDFAVKLREKRLSGGSLNLDMPETKLLLDEKGEVKGWKEAEHHWAHELIEDMMLAANRAVAEYLIANEIPGMFRIHEEPDPDALEKFADFAREFGINMRPPYDRMKLKYALDRASKMEAGHAIHFALLTSLKQARYSAECHPHFALNFSRYLHFTSPIRRYPDLLVHRALAEKFEPGQSALPETGGRRKGGDSTRDYYKRIDLLRALADHCSRREREAAAAEQDVIKFRQMQFLRRNMRESHPGIITRVRDFGFFVELQDCFVEGLVRIKDLTDDWYEYVDERHLFQGRKRGRSFQLGDKVEVRVIEIDLARKQVNLEVV